MIGFRQDSTGARRIFRLVVSPARRGEWHHAYRLLRRCMSRHPGAQTPMEAVARCIGIDSAALELLTLAGCGVAGGRGLKRLYGCAVGAALQVLRMLCGRAISNFFVCGAGAFYRASTTELQTSSWLATPTWPFKTNFWTRALPTTRSLIESIVLSKWQLALGIRWEGLHRG